ncbi:hypothetical protein CDAR_299351 [Caerostris darwini]|uniref:Uncharacterized protein n=1 Tax=Caerostris darwini TaxID=1538125 RepID=A0AAV4RSZ1_9ARAC|nr:hypothetical protein CDAR_299351 [Caerostris darwini]
MFVVGHKLNFKTSEKFQSFPFIRSHPSFGISITLSERKQRFRQAVERNSSFTDGKKTGYQIKDKRGSILDAEGYVSGKASHLLYVCAFWRIAGRYKVEMEWVGNVRLLLGKTVFLE